MAPTATATAAARAESEAVAIAPQNVSAGAGADGSAPADATVVDAPAGGPAVRLVFIGGGPAATMLLERLLASHRREHPQLRLDIRLVDPHEPGGGRIWRRQQSSLLKLNSMLEDVAVFTDSSCSVEGPIEPGPSLAEWVRMVRGGLVPLPDWSDPVLEAEIAEIGDRDFPTRRLNNAYLGWAYREVLRRAAPTVAVSWQRGLAVAVDPVASADGEATAQQRVRLETGEELLADLVVHTLGHNGSAASEASVRFDAFADRHSLRYLAPSFTAELDLSDVPAGEHVIVRGMGLAAVDLVVLLTEGRGGRFERDGDNRLRYLPSGDEPVIHLGSRRGVPYRSKTTSTIVGDPVELEYLGAAFHQGLADRVEPLDFERDVWPLICAELITGYYRELFTAHPHRVGEDWAAFSERLRTALAKPGGFESGELDELIRSSVPRADDRFRLAAFDRPLDFPSEQASPETVGDGAHVLQRSVIEHIESDLKQRTSQEHSASQALFMTALFSYMSVAEIPVERWNAVSRVHALPRRWHSFFSYLASGPPGHRLEELLALAESGSVRFLGGDIEITADDHLGRFVASGSATTPNGRVRATVTADTLIDAWLPEAQAGRSDNPLLRHLVATGQATELCVADARFSGSTGQVLVAEGGALPDAVSQFAVGPFTSAPGAGAFTRPGIDSLPFRTHDRAARAVLGEAALVAARGSGILRG